MGAIAEHVQKPEENLQEMVLSSHPLGPRDQSQIIGLRGWDLHLLSHLNSPKPSLSWWPLRLYFKSSPCDFWSFLKCSKNISWSCYSSYNPRMTHHHFRTKSTPCLPPGLPIPGSCLSVRCHPLQVSYPLFVPIILLLCTCPFLYLLLMLSAKPKWAQTLLGHCLWRFTSCGLGCLSQGSGSSPQRFPEIQEHTLIIAFLRTTQEKQSGRWQKNT